MEQIKKSQIVSEELNEYLEDQKKRLKMDNREFSYFHYI